MKFRIEVENFSGKSVESVYQDFHDPVVLRFNRSNIVVLISKPHDLFVKT